MQQRLNTENQFVVEALSMLRKERFSLSAWFLFLKSSWEMSCKTANAHPTLKRSWMRITIFIFALTAVILTTDFLLEGAGVTLRLLPGFLFCVIWQQSDLFWHLGLNRQAQSRELLPVVGTANSLTWLRGLGACYLLGRLVGGIGTSLKLALIVFLAGIITDILDGVIARRTRTQSKLGAIGDSEADFCLSLSLIVIFIQNSNLPLWLGLLMLLRFLIPAAAAFGSYFLFAHPVRFGSTSWGKYAGCAQCLYFLVLLAPPQLAFLTQIVTTPLLVAVLFLLIAAPIVQIIKNARMA